MDPSHTAPIAIIGGGATGLAAAFQLAKLGRKARLFEASARLGGVVRTDIDPAGWLTEAGPNTLLTGESRVDSLLDELRLSERRLRANPEARNRYILRGGVPVPVPLSPGKLLGTKLLSGGTRLRLLAELFRRPRRRSTDLALATFIESHFGHQFVDYALQPFVSGVYAGDARKLSARLAFPQFWEWEQTRGSLIRGQIAAARARREKGQPRPEIISFPRGLQEITDALASRLPAGTVETDARIEALVRDRGWKVIWTRGGITTTENFSAVVLALPAHPLAKLTVGSFGERPFASFDAIEYPPVASVFLGYRREQVAHALDGFGLLIPAAERRDVLGVLFSSSLFSGRAPEGHVALTALMGGALRPELARLNPEEAQAAVERELAAPLGITGSPVFVRHMSWPRAIPQYNLGYERFTETMVRREAENPGLFIGGQARDGISFPACLASGLKLGDRASDFSRSNPINIS